MKTMDEEYKKKIEELEKRLAEMEKEGNQKTNDDALETLEDENKALRRLLAEKENAEIRNALLACEDDSDDDSDWMQFVQEEARRRAESRWRIAAIIIAVILGLWLLGQYMLTHMSWTITIG